MLFALTATGEAFAADPPGSLPSGSKPVYNDNWRGWPVKPFTTQPPIRGTLLDPRSGFHFGVDINVNDAKPEEGAPAGTTHRVYAVEGGSVLSRKVGDSCSASNLRVAHFAYWHISATVSKGAKVKAGSPIGWTCSGNWHIHLSEYQTVSGKSYAVNPLLSGHKLPFADTNPPLIHAISFNAPAATTWSEVYGGKVWQAAPADDELDPAAISGFVDIRARVEDAPPTPSGWWLDYPRLHAPHHPYELSLEIRNASAKVVYTNTVFRADRLLDNAPWNVSWSTHFAPGTRQSHPAQRCLDQPSEPCNGIYWLRLFTIPTPYWDSSTVANGTYTLIVRARDVAGNSSSKTVSFTVAN